MLNSNYTTKCGLKLVFTSERVRSQNHKRGRKSAYILVKIKYRCPKQSHKLDRVGVGRNRTFPFSSDSAYDSVIYWNYWQPDCWSQKRKRKDKQGLKICQIWRILRQNCSDDSAEVTEGVTLTPKIFGKKQGATLTPEIFGNKHSFVLTFFATNTIYVNCKHCKP